MYRLYSMILAIAATSLLSFSAWTEEQNARAYLPRGSVDAKQIAPAPPRPGSPGYEREMAVVLWMQLTRTPDQVAFVQKNLDVDRFAFIVREGLFSVDGAALKTVVDDAIDEVRMEYDALKAEYDLPRPFQVSDKVEPVVGARPVESYPSGHAIRAIVYARLLAEVFPEHRTELIDYAIRVGYGRVIAGVHYPMDVVAGQKLGQAYADVIVKQPAFLAALKRLRVPD